MHYILLNIFKTLTENCNSYVKGIDISAEKWVIMSVEDLKQFQQFSFLLLFLAS
jgi:hypothetical protein